jgi:hypothetical protein
MNRTHWSVILAVLALTILGGPVLAAEPDKEVPPLDPSVLPKAGEIKTFTAVTKAITLKGIDDSSQLLLTAESTSGRLQDLTSDVTYEISDKAVATVSPTGRVLPLANGKTVITAKFADKKVEITVTVVDCDKNLPINFGNQIVPIFTKLGCNSGGCHGKASGQNGFRLSLLGFDPELDYTTLVKEGRGRRLFPASPENSLLLVKAVGIVAHGGGKKMEQNSDEYKLVRRWIAAGMPFGSKDDPTVKNISIVPEHRVLTRNNKQQFTVFAHYSDGSVVDITRRAQYESNDTEIAVVDPNALVRTLALSGEAAIMARYQGHVAVFRGTVPVGGQTPNYNFAPNTLADNFTLKKWKELGLVPSELCSDEQFIRRVSLDLTGTLPTPAKLKAFLADGDPKKRDKLIDELLESPEYAYFFATKWADVLRVKRRGQPTRAYGTFGFHGWIKDSMARDKPYNEFAREILAATGDEQTSPPVVWYKELATPENFVDDTAQVFLGQRLACAQCHHHPYEKWSQDDYWGLAAFFGRVQRKNVVIPGQDPNNQNTRLAVFSKSTGPVNNKRTGQVAPTKPLDGTPMDIGPEEDPRQRLVDWMTAKENPFFAKAVANRYWAHFFGRGIVDPLDDMRVTNPPSNPELLDALAKDFVEHGYSLKHLVRTLVKSRTYQLSSTPNDFNKHDKQNYARYYPRRMPAEVLLDAVNQVTDSPTAFGGLPTDTHAPKRAIMLPDESFQSYFLDVFGRPQRISASESERVSEANLAQALHLLNSDEVQQKLTRAGGRADTLSKDMRPDAEKVEELFLWAFGRKPEKVQLDKALEHIAKHKDNKKVAYENILWALLNTKEFIFNQ